MANDLTLELERLDRERSTGVLCLRDGAFHLADGAITFAECRRATGLDRLAAAAQVATATEWSRAAAGDPGPLLARPRLEVLASLAVFDAAYFLLAAPAGTEFRPAAPHWLAALCRIPPATMLREVARCGDPGVAPWPADLVDHAPIVPVRHIARSRVMLTGAQAEVLAAADRCRTVAAVARDLGRTTYGCLAAVRELTAAGLVLPPDRGLPDIPAAVAPAVRMTTGGPPGPLPRRQAGAAGPAPLPERWTPVDKNLLIRLRAALEELA